MASMHILLVSNQLLGNIIPTLMDRPDRAALVVTESMRPQAARLTEILEQQGIGVQRFDDAPEVDMPRLEEFALDVLSRLAGQADELVLNLTGGTKLMAIGFLDVLRSDVDRCVYTDTAHGRLEILPAREPRQAPRPLGSVLDIPTYLLAQGFRVRQTGSANDEYMDGVADRKQLCKRLGRQAPDWGDFLGALNNLASRAMDGDELVWPEQRFESAPHGRWAKALDWLSSEGLLDWEGGPDIAFLDPERTRFLNGGWLEEYVYHWFVDEGADHVDLSVTGTWEGTHGARNELDVVAVHANRLLVVECKTTRHGRDVSADDQQFYKLDSLSQDVRGLFGHTWFVTARHPSEEMHKRARQHGIEVIGPGRLPTFRSEVRGWLEAVRPKPA
ncbi:hypothetical protein KBTX_02388 [wastewater metagenome]|uniref:DUF1887 family protein n=2 Tax=unclassified sequences TaxID=12908 RepID=A0A5B8RA33_9ZZZZ|nr:hypothetical protein KBTEX_02388 [uncultured organism]